ncbi:MAG: serine protease, partial [Xanthomonadales bacterium]|nr:serine protease [Xanthomonadales bacterium]
VDPARSAVALYTFSERGGSYICSGGLIADDDATGRPLFLTANHCVSKGRAANSVEAFWDYDTPCGGSCERAWANGSGVASSNGAQILATNRTSDYTVLELTGPLPGTRTFLGVDSAPVAFNNGQALYRISHPAGSPQSYSQHDVDTTKGTCTSWPRGDWIYSRDMEGATEGGSSGSPVLNAAGNVVGQLSGACGFNVNDNCDADSNATVDGAIAAYYSDIAAILAGNDGGGDGGGGGGSKPCNPNSPKCNP